MPAVVVPVEEQTAERAGPRPEHTAVERLGEVTGREAIAGTAVQIGEVAVTVWVAHRFARQTLELADGMTEGKATGELVGLEMRSSYKAEGQTVML